MTIRIDIPNIGPVVVENAAQEDTLRQLLGVMGGRETRARRSDAEAANASRKSAAAAQQAEQSLGQMAQQSKQSSSASGALFSSLQRGIEKAANAGDAINTSGVANYLKQLGVTATDVAATWAKNFREIRVDPITRSASLFATTIDASTDALQGIAGAGGAVLSKLGPLGEALGGLGAGIAKPVIAMAGGALKTANSILAKEMTDTVKAMDTFNKMGGSFANSFMQLRTYAQTAGLNVDQYAAAIKAAEPGIRGMGMNVETASYKVSKVMDSLGTETGKNGRTLRNELRSLGYSTEEQVSLSAEYMANLRSTMDAQTLYKMSSKDIAQGTRKYATDLKVLSDITGQDAKKLQERARAESQRGALLSKLDADQQKSFTDTSAALSVFPETVKSNIQNALVQQLAGGTITDPVIATSKELTEYVKSLAKQIQAGSKTMTGDTAKQAAELQNNLKRMTKLNQGLGGVTDTVTAFGVGGLPAQIAGINNAIMATNLDPKAIEASIANAEKQAAAGGKFNEGLLAAQDSSQKFAVEMSRLAGLHLPAYAQAIGKATTFMTEVIQHSIQAITGEAKTPSGRTVDYTMDQYIREMGAIFQKTFKDYVPRRAKGLPTTNGPELAVIGEAGAEAVIPLEAGNVPVKLLSSGESSSSKTTQQLQETFSNTIAAIQRQSREAQQQAASKQTKSGEDLPTVLKTAIGSLLTGPGGIAQAMTDVKNQIAYDGQQQVNMLQQQLDKMTTLTNKMEENVRYSERIANELG